VITLSWRISVAYTTILTTEKRSCDIASIAWTHSGPSFLAAFLASSVEFVEALTVILAVGSVRGWRDAVLGAAAAVGVLCLLVAVMGSAVTLIPLDAIQLAVGALTLLFGLRWLRKAILRGAGVMPLHDEEAAFAKQTAAMRGLGAARGWDRVAFGATFQIAMLEGGEVVFIVVAVGAGGAGLLLPATAGALAALLLVAALGLAIHQPLGRIPENSLKFVVGVLLSGFGTFWVGEGIGIDWPGGDWSMPALAACYLVVALIAVPLCRTQSKAASAARA
jgi:Ca2+/H+ antiporter, TMEM165/GDT1 family